MLRNVKALQLAKLQGLTCISVNELLLLPCSTNQQKEVIAMKKLLEVLMTYFLTICVGMLLFAFLVFLLKYFFKMYF